MWRRIWFKVHGWGYADRCDWCRVKALYAAEARTRGKMPATKEFASLIAIAAAVFVAARFVQNWIGF